MDEAERQALRAKYEKPALALPEFPWLRSPRVGLWLACVATFLGYIISLKIPLQRCDDFYKIIGGWSIALGKGYCDISRPDSPLLTKYPPFASVLMAPFMGLVGDFLRPLRLLSMFSYLASLPLLYRLLLPRTGHRLALLLLLVSGLNPIVLRVLNLEGNGGIMALLVVGTLFIVEQKPTHWSGGKQALVLAFLLTTYFYTHRMGMVLSLGVVLHLALVQRQWRTAIQVSVLTFACCFPWLWRSHQATGNWISREYEAEIDGRIEGDSSLGGHLLAELRNLPGLMGYHLFPWSRASGGAPWPFLQQLGLTWVATLSEWLVSGLLVVGWVRCLREKKHHFVDLYLALHTAMLLVFFINIAYYLQYLPWLYFYVAVGARTVLRGLWQRAAWPGYLAILLILLAKDAKAFWLMPGSLTDYDARWRWVAKLVPEREAVYYLGLENYAFSQLRYFDTGRRMAVGVTEAELTALLSDPKQAARWICLSKTAPQNAALQAAGWQPVVAEPDSVVPSAQQLAGLELSAAQKTFIASIAPPQVLWHRP